MGDLIAADGFENISAPFNPAEYQVAYKSDRQYFDFKFGNSKAATCQYPRFWNESGFPVTKQSDPNFSKLNGCFKSEFDQVSNFTRLGDLHHNERFLGAQKASIPNCSMNLSNLNTI